MLPQNHVEHEQVGVDAIVLLHGVLQPAERAGAPEPILVDHRQLANHAVLQFLQGDIDGVADFLPRGHLQFVIVQPLEGLVQRRNYILAEDIGIEVPQEVDELRRIGVLLQLELGDLRPEVDQDGVGCLALVVFARLALLKLAQKVVEDFEVLRLQ